MTSSRDNRPLLIRVRNYIIFSIFCEFAEHARVLLAAPKMEESHWERSGAWSKRNHNRHRRRRRV